MNLLSKMITKKERELLFDLGQKIKKIRLGKDISQIALATEINIEKSNMSRIEAGRTNPTYLTLSKIAKALDVELSFLVDMKE